MNCTKFNTLKSRVSKRNTREFIYSSSNLLVIILTLVHRSCVLGAVIDSFRSIGDRHRAWDKGQTAEVESSHGRVNPTNSRVKSTLKSSNDKSRVKVAYLTVTSTFKVDF